MNLITGEIPLYHFTHIDNLRGIIEADCLWCDNITINNGLPVKGISYATLKDRRKNTRVSCYPATTLADYVPFYFCNRSPMLYTIHKGNVEIYKEGQASIVYLVTDMKTVIENKLQWCFSDGHGVMQFTGFYNSLNDLNQIDWATIETTQWYDTPDDNDRKRRKQAEFLIHNSFPWSLVRKIGVYDQIHGEKVSQIIKNGTHQPLIAIEKNWYY